MRSRTISLAIITCSVTLAQFCQGPVNNKAIGSQNDSVVEVYMPREVTIKDDCIRLGQVSILRGSEPLVARVSQIALGQISVPGQEIVVDRSTVLSRLACNGIPFSKVTFTGAEKITIRQEHHVIKGTQFVELARSFLKKKLPANSVHQLSPVWIPKDLVLPGPSKDVKLSLRLVKSGSRNQAKIEITVLAGGKEIGGCEVAFRLKYNSHTVVTLVEIPAGEVISPNDVKIEKTVSHKPEPANWKPPYGLMAKRRLPANTVIRPDSVGPVKPAIAVRRNETVVIRIERPGFLVTAIGKALKEARPGEYVKVRNVDSQRIILCRVNEDGTVEPIL